MGSFRKWKSGFLEDHHNVGRVITVLSRLLPPLNYITIHYTYFTIGCLLSSLVFWGSSQPFGKITYVDSLFMVTSAFTNTGLNTVNVSDMTTWQQVLLWLLMIVGSPIWVSIWTVIVRKNAFERRFKAIVAAEKDMKKRQASLRRAPALHNMLRIRKLDTEPRGMTITKGPDSAAHMGDDHNLASGLSGFGSRLERLHSVANASTTPVFDRERTIVAEMDDARTLQVDGNRDNVSIPQGLYTQTQVNPLRDSARPEPRASTESNGSSSIDLEDFLFHWEKILGRHNVSHNGQFHGLTSEQREQIGGTEYRALKILALTVPTYFILWQLLGAIALGAWMASYAQHRSELMQVQPWWAGIFLSISAFNNGGLSVFDDSLVSFGRSYFVLIVAAFLILAGNTAYPILLRFIFWSILKILNATTSPSTYGPWKETLQFILKYPRRVYTTLFPRRATWWLTIVLIIINSIDWICFEVLNIGNPKIEAYGVAQSIMDGWFQSISVRAAGLVVFPLSDLYIAMQVVYLIMMYISVYPVVITMRTSNVYEERSLGIYDDEKSRTGDTDGPLANTSGSSENPFMMPSAQEPNKGQFIRRRMTKAAIGKSVGRAMTFHGVGAQAPSKGNEESSRVNFISQQIRGQLAHDLWWLALAVLIIVLIETSHFMGDPLTYSVFNVLFESVSAYGCVGLSIGFPNQAYSFSGGCYVGSKLVLCLVMLRGRHRGLPVAVDGAVRLPGEKLHEEEEEDSRIRRTMTIRPRGLDL